jgi:predicted DNA-binding transcriptional regulator AlpA
MSIVGVLEKTQHVLTVAEVPKILNMSPRTIYHHVASGRIPGAVFQNGPFPSSVFREGS